MSNEMVIVPAEQLAKAWQMLLDARDSRDRWERHVENAENHFADLATQHDLTWTEAVEVVNDWNKAHQ